MCAGASAGRAHSRARTGIPACSGGCPPGEAVPAVWGGGTGRVWWGTQPGGHTKEGSEEPEGLGGGTRLRDREPSRCAGLSGKSLWPHLVPHSTRPAAQCSCPTVRPSLGSADSSVLTKGLGAQRCQVPTQPA